MTLATRLSRGTVDFAGLGKYAVAERNSLRPHCGTPFANDPF